MIIEEGAKITLWYIVEDGPWPQVRQYFVTKIEAERAARALYPDEGPVKRYARVYYLESQPYDPCC